MMHFSTILNGKQARHDPETRNDIDAPNSRSPAGSCATRRTPVQPEPVRAEKNIHFPPPLRSCSFFPPFTPGGCSAPPSMLAQPLRELFFLVHTHPDFLRKKRNQKLFFLVHTLHFFEVKTWPAKKIFFLNFFRVRTAGCVKKTRQKIFFPNFLQVPGCIPFTSAFYPRSHHR